MILAARHADGSIRQGSSSGGVFYELAYYVLSQGGVVIGATWNKLKVQHIAIRSIDDIALLQKSKYAPSSLHNIDILLLLQESQGAPLLFSGTPCQIAAIRLQVSKHYDVYPSNLILMEIACHGVPTQQAFDEFARKYGFAAIDFRAKEKGWHTSTFCLTDSQGKKQYVKATDTAFYNDYISGKNLRSSCHQCKHKYFRSGADITLSDFWGVEAFAPDLDDNTGTSLVFLHTPLAQSIWNKISPHFETRSVHLLQAILYNPSIVRPIHSHLTFVEWRYHIKNNILTSLSNCWHLFFKNKK